MTADDELRARLQRLDPVRPDTALDPSPSLRARQLLETAMTETVQTSEPSTPRRSRLPIMAAAAAAVAALSIGAVVLASDDNAPTTKPKPKTTLALQMPAAAGGASMNSCIQFDVNFLKDMSPAFAGTVTAVDGDTVTLAVDRWYTGGSADVVTLTQPGGNTSVALDGVAFEQGKRYLVTASEGTVNGCGYSGEATADFEKAFDEAFPG